ncbi:olfactory receptor 1361-like [Rhinatrema bivittatum]|uniref:olfactory receptor 1361-like n=1 Tax=Rhinatrema bivittatum TaxID=194408 RepID=UPI00112D67AF|nr:olfactory receptor 1361-like [Rhinatrema bivittatum]
METRNQSQVTEFILLGFSEHPELQTLLFVIFLTMYIITLLGNITIVLLIRTDSRLHTPMYFLLSCLSSVDICFTSITVPKLLANLISKNNIISFSGCFTQLYFFLSAGNMESFLLGIMAVDRYLAICKPLHYAVLMRRNVRIALVLTSWLIVSFHSLAHTVMAASLSYCSSNEIHHFFCDLPPLLKLSCSDTSANELLLFVETTVILMTPLLCILISYICIIVTILGINSEEGRRKAFSTCASHLTVVILQYGPVLFTYIRPSSAYSLDRDIAISVLYSVVASMLNPFIYTIRNSEVKGALRKVICHKLSQ